MFIGALGNRVPLLQLARWQLTASFLMTAAAATVLDGWATLGSWQVSALVASGVAGIVIASTTYFATILRVGPRLTALLFSLTSPFALALAYVSLGETIRWQQGLGIMLVLAGIATAIGIGAASPATSGKITVSRLGIALGVITALGQALGSLFARPAMASGVEPFAAMAIRLGVAVIVFWGLMVLPAIRRQSVPVARGDAGLIVASAFFGATLGMVLLMGALTKGNVGVVSTLSSMTPIVILPMVWLKTGAAPRASAWAGAAMACAGTALISLY